MLPYVFLICLFGQADSSEAELLSDRWKIEADAPKLPRDFWDSRFDAECQVLQTLTTATDFKALALELGRLDEKYDVDKDPDLRSIAFARFHFAISIAKGGQCPEIRELCRPTAEWIANRELKPDATALQHECQFSSYQSFLTVGESADEKARRASFRILVKIWERFERHYLPLESMNSDRVAKGEVKLQLPQSVADAGIQLPFPAEQITDPQVRKDYVTYLHQVRENHLRTEQTQRLSHLRKRFTWDSNYWLTRPYGQYPKQWLVLREGIADEIKDNQLVVQIQRDLAPELPPVQQFLDPRFDADCQRFKEFGYRFVAIAEWRCVGLGAGWNFGSE